MIAKRYQDMSLLLNSMIAYLGIGANMTRLRMNGDLYTRLDVTNTEFSQVFQQYINENQRTRSITQQMSQMWRVANADVRALQQQIKHSGSVLSAEDYTALGIHKNKSRSVHTRPTVTPVNAIRHQSHLLAEIRTSTGTEEIHGSRAALPRGADRLQVRYAITEQERPDEAIVYAHILTFNRANFSIEFDEHAPGKWCHISTQYATNTGLLGPTSLLLTFAIT